MASAFKPLKDQIALAHKESTEDEEKPWYKDSPMIAGGAAVAVGVLAFQGINYRRYRKNKMPPSIFVQQTRVYAQGALVALLFVGIAYNGYKAFVSKKK